MHIDFFEFKKINQFSLNHKLTKLNFLMFIK
jgi:hypothetical protein